MNNYNTTWAKLKSLKTVTSLSWCYIDNDNAYTPFLVDVARNNTYVTDISKETDDCTDFEQNVKSLAGSYGSISEGQADQLVTSIVGPKTSAGAPIVAADKPDDTKKTFITHDWTDKTTWYSGSIFIDWTTLSDDGDHLSYSTAQQYLIDTYHGNLTDEDSLKDSSNRSYRISVRVNGVLKTEQDPHYGTGGDYTINYKDGKIVFLSALSVDDVVEAKYHYASSSVFVVKPDTNKTLSLSFIEVQLSGDVLPRDSARFQAYGWVQSFAPQYLNTNGGPYPLNTLIPIGAAAIYKGIKDFMNGSVKSYPVYPAMGGDGWRGLSQPIYIFDWDYIAKTVIDGSKGMEIRITLDHDTQWGGEFATASFHCTQK